ncbi:elongator complex protein 2-like isoform X2 [Lineus longissimus]|uniref:elongator complex protein 2-like isoform X2 n=1 Tax=Lineus longissimus TaxID=88925 RepID=UPI00315DE3E0
MVDEMDTCYISAACNRTPHSTSWGKNGVIAFGSSAAVALYDCRAQDKVGHITETLVGHKDRVNCVRWIPNEDGNVTELVSCSVDKTALVWTEKDGKISITARLTGHSSSINVVEGFYVPQRDRGVTGENARTIVATVSVDSTVKIWQRQVGGVDFSCTQTIPFGSGFALNVSFTLIPGTSVPMMAVGADDQRVHIFVEQDNEFVRVHALLGHEDWIRGVQFATDDSGDLLLVTCGQDCFIRLWRFSARDPDAVTSQLNIKELSIHQEIKLKENTFTFQDGEKKCCFAVVLESVLSGHENWVYSCHWQPTQMKDGQPHQPMCLLSASMDKTMIVWQQDEETGVWLDMVRVGEVGGNTLGLYGCQFSPEGQSLLAHGYHGAFHLWHYNQETCVWNPGVTVGGHFDSVEDITWDPDDGDFIVSVSFDQTCRLHAPWVRQHGKVQWSEIARPQVHGYDMQCLTLTHKYQLVSAADEKVIRVFNAPKNFMENFGRICHKDVKQAVEKVMQMDLPEGASVPALGLSNKAVYEGKTPDGAGDGASHHNKHYQESYFTALKISEPPTEENLLQNTLWPETQKLYGHGYEIFSLASSPCGTILASVCKASKPEHAGIIMWDTVTWQQLCVLESHSLTVTQLAFSHDGRYLLSVSRDRTWAMFERKTQDAPESDRQFSRIAFTDKKTGVHSRIIWACSWSPDNRYFVTVSRDKKAVIWDVSEASSTNQSSYLAGVNPCSKHTMCHALPFSGCDMGRLRSQLYQPV